jgi:hypothetical protein
MRQTVSTLASTSFTWGISFVLLLLPLLLGSLAPFLDVPLPWFVSPLPFLPLLIGPGLLLIYHLESGHAPLPAYYLSCERERSFLASLEEVIKDRCDCLALIKPLTFSRITCVVFSMTKDGDHYICCRALVRWIFLLPLANNWSTSEVYDAQNNQVDIPLLKYLRLLPSSSSLINRQILSAVRYMLFLWYLLCS